MGVEHIIGDVACDWVTLTAKESLSEDRWMRSLGWAEPEGSPTRDARRMQYRGRAGEHWFLGVGEQQGNPHWMVQVSGAVADHFCEAQGAVGRNHERDACTRFDLQLSVPVPTGTDLPGLARLMMSGDAGPFRTRGAPPTISYHGNSQGMDTMYVGSRSSDRMMRAYVAEKGYTVVLRVEVEFKGELADRHYRARLRGDWKALRASLRGEIERLPEGAQFAFASHLACLTVVPKRVVLESEEVSDERTMRWLNEVVLPAAGRVSAGKLRSQVTDWLERLTEVVAGEW